MHPHSSQKHVEGLPINMIAAEAGASIEEVRDWIAEPARARTTAAERYRRAHPEYCYKCGETLGTKRIQQGRFSWHPQCWDGPPIR
jgi:hypothetical protein